MATVVVLPDAETQMEDALAYTLARFGEAKYLEYLDLPQHWPAPWEERADDHEGEG